MQQEEPQKRKLFKPFPGTALKNEKYERFACEYVMGLKIGAAARNAGYSAKTANEAGSRLLADARIAARVQELLEWKKQQAMITIEDVVTGLKEVAARCMKKKPVEKWDYELGMFIQEVDENGEGVWEFDSNGANKALELLGKHTGAFEKDNSQRQNVINVVIFDDEAQKDFKEFDDMSLSQQITQDIDAVITDSTRTTDNTNTEKSVPSLLSPPANE